MADRFAVIEVDLIRVKGKTEPEQVFALLGDAGRRATAEFQALAAAHAGMIASYRAQDWDAAADRLAACRGVAPGLGAAGLYDLYAERIEGYRAEPPPKGWAGVYVALSK